MFLTRIDLHSSQRLINIMFQNKRLIKPSILNATNLSPNINDDWKLINLMASLTLFLVT